MKVSNATQNVEIGVLWGLGVTQGHRQHNHSIGYSAYDFLFDFNRNCRFRVRASYLSKVTDFNLLHLYLLPRLG